MPGNPCRPISRSGRTFPTTSVTASGGSSMSTAKTSRARSRRSSSSMEAAIYTGRRKSTPAMRKPWPMTAMSSFASTILWPRDIASRPSSIAWMKFFPLQRPMARSGALICRMSIYMAIRPEPISPMSSGSSSRARSTGNSFRAFASRGSRHSPSAFRSAARKKPSPRARCGKK